MHTAKFCTGARGCIRAGGYSAVPDAAAFRQNKNPPSAGTSFVSDCWLGKRGRAREKFVTV